MRKLFELVGAVSLQGVEGMNRDLGKAERLAKKTGAELDGMSKMALGAGKTIMSLAKGFVALAAANALKDIAQDAIKLGGSITDMSNRFGMSTDAVQKWDYVAKQSGTSVDSLGVGFKSLTKSLFDAAAGSKDASANFEVLGINIKDANGNLRSTESVFEEALEKIAAIPNPAERAGMALRVFGRGGQDMLQIINQGPQAIQALIDDTTKYNLILGRDSIKALDDAGDAQDRLNRSLQVLGATATAEFAPGMVKATDALSSFIASLRDPGVEKAMKLLLTTLTAPVSLPWMYTTKVLEMAGLKKPPASKTGGAGGTWDDPAAQNEESVAETLRKQEEARRLEEQRKKERERAAKENAERTEYWQEELRRVNLEIETKSLEDDKSIIDEKTKIYMGHIKERLRILEMQAEAEANYNETTKKLREQDRRDQLAHKEFMRSIYEDIGDAVMSSMQTITDFVFDGLLSKLDTAKEKARARLLIVTQYMIAGGIATGKIWSTAKSWQEALAAGIGMTAGLATSMGVALANVNKYASGTRFSSGGIAIVGERGPEAVMLPEGSKVRNATETRSDMRRQRPVENHWHIGTLVADDRGLKELERRMRPHRLAEDTRLGLAVG